MVLLMGNPVILTCFQLRITQRLLDGFWILVAQNEALDEICSFPAKFLKSVANSPSWVDFSAAFFQSAPSWGSIPLVP